MTAVGYSYDSITGDNNGNGQLTSMVDASGNTTYQYDERGRLIEEVRIGF
jgi:YD repeat-containing protein